MARRVRLLGISLVGLLSLGGCGWIDRAERPAWRAAAENYCMARAHFNRAYAEVLSPISGPGICGMEHPLKLTALADGAVRLDKPLVIDCPLTLAVEDWMANVVQPAAQARFGAAVSELDVFGAYACRPVDNIAGAKLSEHAFGNAVDIAGFRLADGRQISIVRDWKAADTPEGAFLRDAHAGACGTFTTVLGPGADVFHYNHFHLDLAMHGATRQGTRRYCRPTPVPGDARLVAAQANAPAPPSFAASPVVLPGAEIALPPAPVDAPALLEPPILPDEPGPGVDASPTSSVPQVHDD